MWNGGIRYEEALTCFGVYSWDSWQIRRRSVVKPRIHESPNELRIPTNAYEYYDSVTMSKNALRICYELTTIFWNREFVAKILNISKLLPRIPDRSRIERIDYE